MRALSKTTIITLTLVSLLASVVNGAEATYTVIPHPSPEPPKGAHLGHSVAALDWNADGVVDVAGGAPGENRTYVFIGPDFTRHEVVTVAELAEGNRFGNKIAAGDLDGVPGDELVIAAPKGIGG